MHRYNKPQKSIWKKLFSGGWWALFTMFIWELIEEGLESLIAFCISEVIALFIVKAVSTLVIIGATQGVKVCIRRFLTPVVKTLTYKGGHDKMSKIKKFFTWLFANKKSLLGTLVGAVGATAGIAASWTIESLPTIMVKDFNAAPIIYTAVCVILFILNELGVSGKGFESIKTFFERIEQVKLAKEEKAIVKEAKKELVVEQKRANQTQAEQEKAKAKADAVANATAEREKAEADHRAKVEAAKAKLLAERNKSN